MIHNILCRGQLIQLFTLTDFNSKTLKNSQSQFFLKNHFQKNENHDINFSQSEKKSDKWMITNYD